MMGIPALTQPKVLIKPSANGYDSKHPDGADPEPGGDSVSGGSLDTLAWTAPNGLTDGKTLVIQSSAHTFVAPEKYIYLGFGDGWLYEQEDGTPIAKNITVGQEQFVYEDNPGSERRFVYTENGVKYLRTPIKDAESGNLVAGGMINWDMGRELVPGDFCYQFDVNRLTVPEGFDKTFQWKQNRIGAYENLPGGATDNANSCYLKHFDAGNVLNAYEGTTSSQYYFSEASNKDGDFAMQGWTWKQNTPDELDGSSWIHAIRDADGEQYYRHDPQRSSDGKRGNGVIRSEFSERPRWAKMQDFFGNFKDSATNIELIRTDLFWQLNGSIFVLANNADLSQSTKFTPLVPISFDGNSWTFKLWRGKVDSYDGGAIFLLDDELNVIQGVSL